MPNFEVIEGIVSHYKNINERWLLTGEGHMYQKQKLKERPDFESRLEDSVKLLIDEIREIKSRLDKLEKHVYDHDRFKKS